MDIVKWKLRMLGKNDCIYLHSDYRPHRGDLISNLDNFPAITNQIEATICWLDETPQQKKRFVA